MSRIPAARQDVFVFRSIVKAWFQGIIFLFKVFLRGVLSFFKAFQRVFSLRLSLRGCVFSFVWLF